MIARMFMATSSAPTAAPKTSSAFANLQDGQAGDRRQPAARSNGKAATPTPTMTRRDPRARQRPPPMASSCYQSTPCQGTAAAGPSPASLISRRPLANGTASGAQAAMPEAGDEEHHPHEPRCSSGPAAVEQLCVPADAMRVPMVRRVGELRNEITAGRLAISDPRTTSTTCRYSSHRRFITAQEARANSWHRCARTGPSVAPVLLFASPGPRMRRRW